jgi:hypothetical protein
MCLGNQLRDTDGFRAAMHLYLSATLTTKCFGYVNRGPGEGVTAASVVDYALRSVHPGTVLFRYRKKFAGY